jgi:hypothetical protein
VPRGSARRCEPLGLGPDVVEGALHGRDPGAGNDPAPGFADQFEIGAEFAFIPQSGAGCGMRTM